MVVFNVLFACYYGSGDSGNCGNAAIIGLGAAFGGFHCLWADYFARGGDFEVAAGVFHRGLGRSGALCSQFWHRFGGLALVARSGVFGCCDPYRLRADHCGSLSRFAEKKAGCRSPGNASRMNVSKTGTARFAAVVEVAGKPEVVSLWTKPERDKKFMAAVRQNRVMTIKQATVGSAKDFGVVGFLREKNSSYLVFPKSLGAFTDRRIVGIKYELIQTPGPLGRIIKPEAAEEKRAGKVQPAEWQPASATHTGKTFVAHRKKAF